MGVGGGREEFTWRRRGLGQVTYVGQGQMSKSGARSGIAKGKTRGRDTCGGTGKGRGQVVGVGP